MKFGVFSKPKIMISVRRFEEEGMLRIIWKAFIYSSVNKLRRFGLLEGVLEKVLKEKYDFGHHET